MCAGAAASQEDINKELGVGAVSADMALDALKDAADAEILAVCNGLGRYVPLIASFCRSGCVVDCWVQWLGVTSEPFIRYMFQACGCTH